MNFQSNFSAPFVRRPVATSLVTIAIFLSGVIAFRYLPVAPLPQVDLPTIGVGAGLPGASPETMASAVATPLERQFGRIAGVTQMTSSSTLGNTGITLQFDLNRDINAAARDVEAAINAARSQLPADIPSQPTYRKVNSADSPRLPTRFRRARFTMLRIPSWRRRLRRSKVSARCSPGGRRGLRYACR